jgi:IPT/TIG domain
MSRTLLTPFAALAALFCLAACEAKGPRLDPEKGSIDGGDTVLILGGPFGPGASVEFGGKPVGTVSVPSPDRLQVLVPEGDAIGPVDVLIIDSHGKRTEIPKGYEYLPRKEGPSGTGGAK